MLTAMIHMLLRRTVKRWFAEDSDVEDTRRKLDRLIALTDGMPHGVSVVEAGHAGSASLYAIGASNLPAKAPAIMYFHGGGYMVGGLTSHAPFCARLAKSVGGRVIFVDYRLAPDAPFPCAFQDCLGAWRMLADQQAGPMILAGDSAGGGLALAVAQAAIAEAARIPDRLILFSPWADMALSGDSMVTHAAMDSMLSTDILTHMRDLYLQGHDMADPRASPLLGPLGALPPTLIVCSDSEVLRDDSRRLAEGMQRAGTPVTLLEMGGQPHVFPLFRILPAARRAMEVVGKFVG